MAIGRQAVETQVAAMLLSATSTPHALPANLARAHRDDTPHDDQEKVFFALGWGTDKTYPKQMYTGTKRLSLMGLKLTLSTWMNSAAVVEGAGEEGALGKETARQRLETYWETLRWRLQARAHWDAGNTGIVNIFDCDKDPGEKVNENRLELYFRATVAIDETVS